MKKQFYDPTRLKSTICITNLINGFMKSTNHYFKPLGLLLLLCLIPLCAFSQNVTVKGIVKDALGESVIGASVVEKGTTNGIITGLDGDFTLHEFRFVC